MLSSAGLLKTADLGNDKLYDHLKERTTEAYMNMVDKEDARRCEEIKRELKPITEAWKTKLTRELESMQLTSDSLNWEAVLKHVSIQALEHFES